MERIEFKTLWDNEFSPKYIDDWVFFYIYPCECNPKEILDELNKEWDYYIASKQVENPLNDWGKHREAKNKFMDALYLRYLQEPQQEQTPLANTKEPQHVELKDLLPEKLKTDEAVKVFQKAIDAKLITYSQEGLKWNDTKQLLAYFATKVSEKFSLTIRLDKDGNKTTAWNPFEALFNEQGLKGAKQNWMRLNTRFEPPGFEKVDALF